MKWFKQKTHKVLVVQQALQYLADADVQFQFGDNTPVTVKAGQGMLMHFTTSDFAMAIVRRGGVVSCSDITADLEKESVK